jgi:hypothetical protein
VRAWVLNLDAEGELELGARHAPSAAVRARIEGLARAIAETLPPGDRVIDPPLGVAAGVRAAFWCPTPQAVAIARRAGLEIGPVPDAEVLRRVNERGFALPLDDLEDVVRATDPEVVESHVARVGECLVKRGLGQAGRGQRPLRPPLSDADRAWVAASLRRGAVYVEPRLAIVRELSVHGWARERAVVTSVRAVQMRDRAFVSSSRARDLAPATERALVDAAERAGAALVAAGYRGPFGTDAFVFRSGSGDRLRALSEINARFCMGWDAEDGWE